MAGSGFIWVILAVAVYGVIHSLLASLEAKALAERWFGPEGHRLYRLFFNSMAVLTFAPVLLLAWRLPDVVIYRIPLPWVLLTLAVQALAVIGLVVGVGQTGAADFLGLAQLRGGAAPPHRMVSNGLYRWVRHPLYTCGLAFIWLSPQMSWNLLGLNLGVTAYLVIGALFEERKLLREFGPAYAEYRRRTPMLLPGLKWKR